MTLRDDLPDPMRLVMRRKDGRPSAVLTPPHVADLLDNLLRAVRIAERGNDRELSEYLGAIHWVAVEQRTYVKTRKALTPAADQSQSSCPRAGWIDSTAAADILGCGVANVRDLARRGRLRGGSRIGNRLMWPEDNVREYAAQRARKQ